MSMYPPMTCLWTWLPNNLPSFQQKADHQDHADPKMEKIWHSASSGMRAKMHGVGDEIVAYQVCIQLAPTHDINSFLHLDWALCEPQVADMAGLFWEQGIISLLCRISQHLFA